jgi:Domain of unknown function (DUF4167)
MRHAERPKQKHEHAPIWDGVVCAPLTAMGIKRASPSPKGFSQRAKKLRALCREARAGNTIAAENYYRHAEHYFRSMSGGLSSAFMRCSASRAASSARLRCSASRKIARDITERVHVCRGDALLLAVVVDVLQGFLAGQALMIFATRRSLTVSDHCLPPLPMKRKRTCDPLTATWRRARGRPSILSLRGRFVRRLKLTSGPSPSGSRRGWAPSRSPSP